MVQVPHASHHSSGLKCGGLGSILLLIFLALLLVVLLVDFLGLIRGSLQSVLEASLIASLIDVVLVFFTVVIRILFRCIRIVRIVATMLRLIKARLVSNYFLEIHFFRLSPVTHIYIAAVNYLRS